MPIDASIPLQVRGPQFPDAMNALRLRSAVQQQQLYPMQVQALQQENQQRMLENQQRQRSLDASQAIADAFKNNTTVSDDGSINVDHGGVHKYLVDKGFGPEALKVDADSRAAVTAALNQEEAAVKLHQTQAARFGALTNSVIDAVNGAGDDDAQKENAYKIALPQAINSAFSEKLINKDQADALSRMPYNEDSMASLNNFSKSAMTVDQQMQTWNQHVAQVREALLAADTHKRNVAELPGQQADADQKVRAGLSARLANAQTPEEYGDILDHAKTSNPAVAAEAERLVPKDQFDPDESPDVLRNWGLTSEQATTAQQRQTTQESTDAYRKSTEAWRQARLKFQEGEAQTKNNAGGKPLTPGQRKVEERNIYNDEYGTSVRPGGLNGSRARIGNVLSTGKDPRTGQPLTPQQRADWQAQYDSASNSLQALQYRKAELYSVPRPDQGSVDSAKEGDSVDAGDGHLWKKKGGVAWYQGQGTAPAPAAATPPPAAATPPPAAAPAPAPAAQPAAPAPKPASSAAPAVGSRFSNGKQTVRWNGTNWIDEATNKPAQF